MHIDLSKATFDSCTYEQKEQLRVWKKELDALAAMESPFMAPERAGLWVYGPRRSGSSYVAMVAMRHLAEETFSWEYVPALLLTENLRRRWALEDLVRRHPDDYGLWREADDLDTLFQGMWHGTTALWVDDLHGDEIDMRFWKRHVQPHLTARVKRGQRTIIATSLDPGHEEWGDLTPVILGHFVVVEAVRGER